MSVNPPLIVLLKSVRSVIVQIGIWTTVELFWEMCRQKSPDCLVSEICWGNCWIRAQTAHFPG